MQGRTEQLSEQGSTTPRGPLMAASAPPDDPPAPAAEVGLVPSRYISYFDGYTRGGTQRVLGHPFCFQSRSLVECPRCSYALRVMRRCHELKCSRCQLVLLPDIVESWP